MIYLLIVTAVLLVVLSVILALCLVRYSRLSNLKAELDALLSSTRTELGIKEKELEMLENNVRENNELRDKALKSQIDAIKAEMSIQTEKVLKAREEELTKNAQKTFSELTGSFGKDFKEMKEAFEKDKILHTESSVRIKESFENAVKNLETQTASIGRKADNLAEAMRGEVKGQGMWGETIFEHMLETEGFVKGRDYEREDVIRDELGSVIHTDEGRGLRPDFVIHYPDNTDVVVDSKVSLAALYDYLSAETDEARNEAAKRNLESVRNQFNLLAKKDYSRYFARSGRRSLDYVLMFIPNYGALALAKELDPDIWREAFSNNVLIVTEETVMPFLRMIRSAWVSAIQVRNQAQILEAARHMIDRVSDFAKANAEIGRHLDIAREAWEKGDLKLRDSGQSIIVSARQVLKLGVPSNPQKPLPEPVSSQYVDENV